MPFGIIFWLGLLTHVLYVRVIWYDCKPLTSVLRTYEISCLNHEHDLFRRRSSSPQKENKNHTKNYAKKLTHVLLHLYRISILNACTGLYHYTGK